ncbi:hypothetical protein Tco_1145386 [Tanacetum coccineum]
MECESGYRYVPRESRASDVGCLRYLMASRPENIKELLVKRSAFVPAIAVESRSGTSPATHVLRRFLNVSSRYIKGMCGPLRISSRHDILREETGKSKYHVPACLCFMLYCDVHSERFNLAYYMAKRMEWVTKQARLILPYSMLLTHLFKSIMNEYPELYNESYVLYDCVMNPLAAQLEQKPRRDRGTRRGRHSTSSSSGFDQPSSSHLNDDDDDGNDEGTSRASTPSPISYVNSIKTSNQVLSFSNPPMFRPKHHRNPFYTRQPKNPQPGQVQFKDGSKRGGVSLDRSMDSDKYLEGQSMQRPPLFESDSFIYWKNRFETYVKSKDLDLWHVITNGDFQPIIQNPETKLDEVNCRVTSVQQIWGYSGFNCKRKFGHFAKEYRKAKRVKDSTYHKDEEIDEQRVGALTGYLAKIQEFLIAVSGH